jgi:hypothetical protein
MEQIRKRQMTTEDEVAVMLQHTDSSSEGNGLVNEDLEQLIKANGDDIEFEFYVAGEPMLPNQTIYEIVRSVENKAKR